MSIVLPATDTGRPPRADREDLPALTSLRFVAAFAILLLHYRDLLGPLPAGVLRGIVGGQYGVTFFFVLSGFILTYRYQPWFAAGASAAPFWQFQRYRLARIYPVYLLGLLLDTPWHLIHSWQAGQLAEVGQTYWAAWLINLLGLQVWVPAVPFAMFWNTPAWSVAAELFFYATFPFACAWLCARRPATLHLGTLLAAVIVGGMALYAAVIYLLNYVWRVGAETQYIVLVYNPLLRYSEFLAGCIAGHLFLMRDAGWVQKLRSPGFRRGRDALLAVALLAVCARTWSPDYTGSSQWLWLLDVAVKYGVFILPFVAVILAVASGRTLFHRWLEQRWMVALGEASYALYIIHWSATSFLRLNLLGPWGTPLVHLLFLLATIPASLLVYRWVEVPWRKRLRGGYSWSMKSETADPSDACRSVGATV